MKVIGISKLRSKYKPFEAKRQLCASYDLFLADERVIELLPPLLGKTFFGKKKHPIPIDLKKDPQVEYQRILSSAYVYFNKGTCKYFFLIIAQLKLDPQIYQLMKTQKIF